MLNFCLTLFGIRRTSDALTDNKLKIKKKDFFYFMYPLFQSDIIFLLIKYNQFKNLQITTTKIGKLLNLHIFFYIIYIIKKKKRRRKKFIINIQIHGDNWSKFK